MPEMQRLQVYGGQAPDTRIPCHVAHLRGFLVGGAASGFKLASNCFYNEAPVKMLDRCRLAATVMLDSREKNPWIKTTLASPQTCD